MSGKRTPGRSLDEWMELVTACRQSGLTDAAWCHEHGIPPSCFTMQLPACVKEPARYLIHRVKPALLTLHPINRMWFRLR